MILQDEQEKTHKSLVLLAESAAESQRRTDERFQALAESQQRMDDALTALMGTVDSIIRQKP